MIEIGWISPSEKIWTIRSAVQYTRANPKMHNKMVLPPSTSVEMSRSYLQTNDSLYEFFQFLIFQIPTISATEKTPNFEKGE